MQRVVTIAIFYVTTDRMSHVGRMYTYLILSASFKFVFYQSVLSSAVEYVVVCHRIFASIVNG